MNHNQFSSSNFNLFLSVTFLHGFSSVNEDGGISERKAGRLVFNVMNMSLLHFNQ